MSLVNGVSATEGAYVLEGHFGVNRRCPLCGQTDGFPIQKIPFSKIWGALERDFDVEFTEDLKHRLTPAEHTILWECCTCGLQYFDPAEPGNGDFYQTLATGGKYYGADKWDFREAASLIATGERVLDVACGEGRFLEMLAERGVQAEGIDANPLAISRARHKGLQAHCLDLADFSKSCPSRYDVVTAFHVIEHLLEPRSFLDAIFRCLRPGGRVVMTTPERLRRLRGDFEPLDCPPHHISRWSKDQFSFLAHLVGCRLLTCKRELAGMHECRAILRRAIAKAGRTESLWARALGRLVFSPTLYGFYRKYGMLEKWRMWGGSVMAVLHKNS